MTYKLKYGTNSKTSALLTPFLVGQVSLYFSCGSYIVLFHFSRHTVIERDLLTDLKK